MVPQLVVRFGIPALTPTWFACQSVARVDVSTFDQSWAEAGTVRRTLRTNPHRIRQDIRYLGEGKIAVAFSTEFTLVDERGVFRDIPALPSAREAEDGLEKLRRQSVRHALPF